ncbi:unnamed protein product, partial [Lymnaea stagnalis]
MHRAQIHEIQWVDYKCWTQTIQLVNTQQLTYDYDMNFVTLQETDDKVQDIVFDNVQYMQIDNVQDEYFENVHDMKLLDIREAILEILQWGEIEEDCTCDFDIDFAHEPIVIDAPPINDISLLDIREAILEILQWGEIEEDSTCDFVQNMNLVDVQDANVETG